MKKDPIFYENFPKLRELISNLSLKEDVSKEERQKAFYSLVDLLVKKGVFKKDGTIQKWRENSLEYLREVIHSLEESDLQQVLVNQEKFFDKFIFAPYGKNTSLYAIWKEGEVKVDPIWNISTRALFDYFREKTGKSPYEKLPRTVVTVFVNEVENFQWHLLIRCKFILHLFLFSHSWLNSSNLYKIYVYFLKNNYEKL